MKKRSSRPASLGPVPHWSFPAASVAALAKVLAKAGPGARLEAHLVSGMQLYLRVVPPKGVSLGKYVGVNDSHVCPPQCP